MNQALGKNLQGLIFFRRIPRLLYITEVAGNHKFAVHFRYITM